jgi:hypothetical protein
VKVNSRIDTIQRMKRNKEDSLKEVFFLVIVYFKNRKCYTQMNFNTFNTQSNIYINDILFSYKQCKIQEQRAVNCSHQSDNQKP